MRLLIVEDDERLVSIIRDALSRRGHVIDTAPDAAVGLSMAKEGQYDAVVLDIMLPMLNGLSVARELRESGSSTPILMLTAKDTSRDVVEGINAGADDYLRNRLYSRSLKPGSLQLHDEMDAGQCRWRAAFRRYRDEPADSPYLS